MLCCRLPKEKFFQFMWRPRPPSMLTKEQEEDILKNLRKYSRKYDEEDAQIMSAVSRCLERLIVVSLKWAPSCLLHCICMHDHLVRLSPGKSCRLPHKCCLPSYLQLE